MALLTPSRQALFTAARSIATRLLFPARCPITDQPVEASGLMSPAGWAKLTPLARPACTLCGWPFAEEGHAETLCATCAAPDGFQGKLTGPRRLERVRSALVYDKVSAPLILALKYGDRHDLALPLARQLRLVLPSIDAPPDAQLLAVPLHKRRLQSRRFNQSVLLANALSSLSGLPTAAPVLARHRSTVQQKGLGVAARYRNIAGAFKAQPSVAGGAFVLVDDVLTSGATLVACARALKRQKARWVGAVTVARVLPNSKEPDIDNLAL